MKMKNCIISVDTFINRALYDKNFGYYAGKNPIGKTGDFVTAPVISSLFSEMVTIWIISYWTHLKRPKKFSIIELGPGDGAFCKTLCKVSRSFPEFEKSLRIFMYEKSEKLKKIQKNKIKDKKVKWIDSLNSIKSGPVLFFGNEFFDAIPIKQYKKYQDKIFERFIKFKNNKFESFLYKKISKKRLEELKKLNLHKINGIIEYPKYGLKILENINKKIEKFKGGLLLIDYGFLSSRGVDTLQSVKGHKKNKVFHNIGFADITYHVNFDLLRNFLSKKKLFVNKIVSQSFFLKKLGIIDRANILSNKMTFKEKSDIYYRIERLLSNKYMGSLFKVIFASNIKEKFYLGFK